MTSQLPDSGLARAFADGRFVVTAEVAPPVATDPEELLSRARPLKGLVTAVNVTDGAGARVQLSSLVAGHLLLQSGIEPIVQMNCRDRNRLALQADLLGALALGLDNVLLLTGDDPKAGDQPEAKPVFDLDSRGLLAIANRMRNERCLPTGTAIAGPVGLLLGVADNPVDPPPDWRPHGLLAKLAAGADFVQTQFCMDLGVVRRYAARLTELGLSQRLKLLIGISPIPSARSARWMRERLPGTLIADDVVRRLEGAPDARREGLRICAEHLQALTEIPGVAGAHIMAPRNPAAVPEAIALAGFPTADG